HLVQRPESPALARLSDQQGSRVHFAAGEVPAWPFLLFREGHGREPDRADGSRLHVLRARLARPARRLAVPARYVPAVLHLSAGLPCRFHQLHVLLERLRLLLAELGLRPVGLELLLDRLDDPRFLAEQPDLASAVELERAQA